MDADAKAVTPQALEREVLANIPLAQAMGIRVRSWDGDQLVLTAPFAPNVNHAGIAFGGAIECLATLACWSLLWLRLAEPEAMAVIQRGETTFRKPLSGELHAVARAPRRADFEHFRQTLRRRGRARLALEATVGDSGVREGARFHGRFAVAHLQAQEAADNASNASPGSNR